MATAAVVSLDNNPVTAEKLPEPWAPVQPIPPFGTTLKNSTDYDHSLSTKECLVPLAPAVSRLAGTRANSSPSGELRFESGVRKQRKQSSISLQSDLRRSLSIPHIGGEVLIETATITSPIDKRKNKLGYQRTSMACGHCRRRKIRCIPPTDEDPETDPQGRCTNCIRLKKECIYYPVDHATDTRSGRRDVGSISASSASSPRTPIPPALGSLPIIEANMGRHLEQRKLSETGYSLPENSVLVSAYQHDTISAEPSPLPYQGNFPVSRPDDNSEWAPPEFGASTLLPPPYWASAESTPNRPNFSPNPLSSIGASPSLHVGSPPQGHEHGNQGWPPSRSSSFGHPDSIPGSYQYSEVHTGADMHHHLGYSLDSQSASTSHTSIAESSIHPEQLLTSLGPVVPINAHFQQSWGHQVHHAGHSWLGEASGHISNGNDLVIDQYTKLPQEFYPHATSPG